MIGQLGTRTTPSSCDGQRDVLSIVHCSADIHLAHKLRHKMQHERVPLLADSFSAGRLQHTVQLQQLFAEVVDGRRRLAQRVVLLVSGIRNGRDEAVVKRTVFDGAKRESARDADGADGIKTVCILHTTENSVMVVGPLFVLLLLLLLLGKLLCE